MLTDWINDVITSGAQPTIHYQTHHKTTVDQMYPAIKVSFCRVHAAFSPAVVELISRKLDVPKNMCFLT